MTTILLSVPWYVEPTQPGDMPYYRSCDLCFLSATEDAWAGKHIEDFRLFFQVRGGEDNGLSVCEHCLQAYQRGDVQL